MELLEAQELLAVKAQQGQQAFKVMSELLGQRVLLVWMAQQVLLVFLEQMVRLEPLGFKGMLELLELLVTLEQRAQLEFKEILVRLARLALPLIFLDMSKSLVIQ
jgi:hypothetical protein